MRTTHTARTNHFARPPMNVPLCPATEIAGDPTGFAAE
jgi:hypothetical protein